ncbi:hypothetical protein CRENBAI_000450 [Crenichthys baileyi]|uniref:Uncharacterized protein n=1 Tax=Crenichthys baileyi TaxID=28760 RepID=A0AAV9QZE2_9TELE
MANPNSQIPGLSPDPSMHLLQDLAHFTCESRNRSQPAIFPAEANGVREKSLQRRGLPVWKEDSRDRITVLTRVVSGQDGPPSYSSGANSFVHGANGPSTPPKLPRLAEN